mmetsp:Transcript_30158/g.59184  ORF Transcript_30158/g.59184 Transcript_30158/m.59184 type:complete len:84 (+) Transcript_30158:140-391(+)
MQEQEKPFFSTTWHGCRTGADVFVAGQLPSLGEKSDGLLGMQEQEEPFVSTIGRGCRTGAGVFVVGQLPYLLGERSDGLDGMQ